jgi:3',5'-nucleoside bisphosphate phosphatase
MRRKVEPLLCELHAHTRWSDGALTLPELIDLYGTNGFDVLAVTEHVIRHCDGLPFGVHGRNHADYFAEIAAQAERARRDYDLLVLPGLELTYDADPFESAHTVAVGLRDFVDLDAGLEPALARAGEAGAALIAAHPYLHRAGGTAPARPTQRFSRDWRELGALVDRWELFNPGSPSAACRRSRAATSTSRRTCSGGRRCCRARRARTRWWSTSARAGPRFSPAPTTCRSCGRPEPAA